MKIYIEKLRVNRTFVKKTCKACKKKMLVLKSEIKRGGGKTCSRSCYYVYQKEVRPRGKKSWAWKGDDVGKSALHDWVHKNLGRPMQCQNCKTTTYKKYEWANKSQQYKRDLNDWIRLCSKCHAKYDRPYRLKKWRESVKKLGWNVKDTKLE